MKIQFQLHPKIETPCLNSNGRVNWFRNNNMIVNQEKLPLMLLQKSIKHVIRGKFQIDSNEVKCQNTVTLLGSTIDNHLLFDDHISNYVKKHPCN